MHRHRVNIIIRYKGGVVLVKGRDGWALPGGVLEGDETLEEAATKAALGETGLALNALRQLHTYSGERYQGCDAITTVFIAEGKGSLVGGESPDSAKTFDIDSLPSLAFDHKRILLDYQNGEFEGMD